MKVFLGGTVNQSTWRNKLIPMLKIDYFNPVVDNWTEEAYQRELHERQTCDFCLYVITPRMQGVYSLAEVADDSFKRADRTIYCYMTTDDEFSFTFQQIRELEKLGKLVQNNGAVWKRDLADVADFLNSAKDLQTDRLLQNATNINDVFISYGRRHSLAFAHLLQQNLTRRGLRVWFDMNDIPLGVDFQSQIDEGIRRADNFVYIISPHSVNSIYCDKELELALKYKKRIIPILHVEPQEKATWDKIHPEVQRRNWIYFRQQQDAGIELSLQALTLRTKIVETPDSDWFFYDMFDKAFENLVTLIDSHRSYIRTHTVLLDKALEWSDNQNETKYLLVGNERADAEAWMQRSHQVFKNRTGHLIQPPCKPTDLVAQYIMESKKNGNNLQCDVFICHAVEDRQAIDKIIAALHKHGFSTWMHDRDIRKGTNYESAIRDGVVQSSTLLFFISPHSLQSDYCKKEYVHAQQHNKRIIPINLATLQAFQSREGLSNFEGLETLQYVDFTNLSDEVKIEKQEHSDAQADVEARHSKTPFEVSTDELVNTLKTDQSYYDEHRLFLIQALRWLQQGQQQTFLLRGFNLDNAVTWLRLNKNRPLHPPTDKQSDFIQASEAAKGQLGTEVFISYSRKDADFARRLNEQLQRAGHTTWFDQESISKGVDFEKEIFKGIDGCNNFVFVISPDSIASEYCEREVNYAATHNKRIITLLWRDTDTATIPETLRRINWIDFKNEDFGKAFGLLVQEIETDREYAHAHTMWQQRAQEWNKYKQSPEFLLNVLACKNAESWFAESGHSIKDVIEKNTATKKVKSPTPTLLQAQFIQASRTAIDTAAILERKRRIRLKILSIGAAIVAVLAIFMGGWALNQRQKALHEREKTKMAYDKADSIARIALLSQEKAAQLLQSEELRQMLLNDTSIHKDFCKAFIAKAKKETKLKHYDKASVLLAFARFSASEEQDQQEIAQLEASMNTIEEELVTQQAKEADVITTSVQKANDALQEALDKGKKSINDLFKKQQ